MLKSAFLKCFQWSKTLYFASTFCVFVLSMRLFVCFRAFKQKYFSNIQIWNRVVCFPIICPYSDVTVFLTMFYYASVRNKKITFCCSLETVLVSVQQFRFNFSKCSVTHRSVMRVLPLHTWLLFNSKNCSCVSENYVYCISKIEKRL